MWEEAIKTRVAFSGKLKTQACSTSSGQGPNALVTALKNGTTQIVLSHPLATTTFAISIKVDGSTKALRISKNNFIMIPGDIQELDASVSDGTAFDTGSIMWSVRAATGTDANFLTITGNGGMINIIANSPGQGTVFAVFGTQIAQCDVIVQASKKMSFQTGIVSGNPGASFTVGYDFSPATMSISWTISDSSVASYTDDRGGKEGNHHFIKGRNDHFKRNSVRWNDIGCLEHHGQVGQDSCAVSDQHYRCTQRCSRRLSTSPYPRQEPQSV